MTNEEFLDGFMFTELTEDVLAECEHFSCGHEDLNEYFQKDAIKYARQVDWSQGTPARTKLSFHKLPG